MSWITYTFFAVNFFAITNIFDKFFVSKKYKSIYSFAVIINALYLIFFGITGFVIRDTFIFNEGLVWTILASAAFYFMWIFWWKSLTMGEVSRMSAIFFTNPLFGAILSVIFLGEELTWIKWIAIASIVLGAVLSTLEGKKIKKGINRGYLFVLLATICAALGNVLSKQAMVYWPALTVQVGGFMVALPFYLMFMKNKQVFIEVKETFTNLKSFSLVFLRSFLGFLAICSFMLSIGVGPVSLVSALNGAQPLVILLYTILISVFFPKIIKEEISKKIIFMKAIAVILIVVGAIIVTQ